DKCRDVIRMRPEAFQLLCQKLREIGRVKDSTRSTVEDQNHVFLLSPLRETISRYFHIVLHAILSLEGDFFKQPSGEDVPYEILHSSRFYPFFK
ncbi:hypothetical protein S83_031611, partial [Arachis hypogaea]